MPRPASSAPLVGRAEQVNVLRAALRRAGSGTAGTVLLAGDAGAGKTRLVEELLTVAEQCGATALLGHCIDLGGVGLPYLPFAEALGRVQALVPDRPELADAVGRRPALDSLLGTAVAAGSQDEVGRLQLFDAVGGLLTDLGAPGAPVVLVLEDLHWADQSTRDLLRFLVARARDQHVLLLGTYRADDLHRRHPLRPLLAELVRHATVERVEVPPFTEVELREFAAVVTAGAATDDTVRRVLARSEGNAYFAEELLDAADRDGLPDSLNDVLLARVERLDPAVHRLVRLASVAGRRVSEEVLRQVAGMPGPDIDAALREAVQQHVLVPVEAGFLAFRHALLAEAVYGDLLPGERVRLHAAFAAALAAPGLGSAAELAHHSLASHDLPAALSASLAAAAEAQRRLAPAEELRHLESVLQLWRAVPDAVDRAGTTQVQLLLRGSHAASRGGDPDRSLALAREAVDVAATADDPLIEAGARLPLAKALVVSERPGAFEHSAWALAVLSGSPAPDRDAEAADPALPTGEPFPDLVRGAAVHARVALNCDRDEVARRWAQWALDAAQRLRLPGVEADVLTTLAVLEAREADVAADLLAQAHARAVEAADLGVELRSTYNLASNRYYTGDVATALQHMERGRRRAEQTGTRWSVWGLDLRVLEVVARYVQGDWDGSARVAALVGNTPPDLVAARLAAAGLHVRVGRGDPAAVAAAERLRPAWERDGQIALLAGGTLVDALTWAGRGEQAVAEAQTVVAFLARTWNDYFLGGIWLSALALAALADRAASPRGRGAGPQQELLDSADALREHALATAHRGRPRFGVLGPEGRAWLARVDAEHSRVHGPPDPARWQAAVDAFTGWYPYEEARSRWRLAEALVEGGDRDGAAEQAARASTGARRLGAVPLRDGVHALAQRARLALPVDGDGSHRTLPARPGSGPLTPREAAVLALVAEGLTNRQVGERLFISDKTVSVHLSNVMAKLGATGRTEAVSVAHRRGLLTEEPR